MKLLYSIGLYLFEMVLIVISPFHEKARQMRQGRKTVWDKLKVLQPGEPLIWVHCASLGEFEQGRPIIEALKKKHPEKRIMLSFYSPSGYEVRKNYDLADLVVYLPSDSPANARRFVKRARPEKAIFVKYEFWPNYFRALHRQGVPIYSVSAIFRKNQIFFKWYGGWFRKVLAAVTKFYVQDQTSGDLLKSIGIDRVAVTGDTRFDRVAAIVRSAVEVPEAADFVRPARQVIVAGSTWPPDEEVLAAFINTAPEEVRLILAPHEVHEGHVARLIQRFTVPVVRYTQLQGADVSNARVLVIDVIGKLSAIYRYGQIAYIGGGFGKGIHNTLEAATYGMPVIFGPRYLKFKEAVDLIETGGGFSVDNTGAFRDLLQGFLSDPINLKAAGKAAGSYTRSMCGATDVLMEEVFNSRE